MEPFPLLLNLQGRRCLVVGESDVLAQQAAAFLQAGAEVWVAAQAPCPALLGLLHQQHVAAHTGPLDAQSLRGFQLIVSTSADPEFNQWLLTQGRQAGAWVHLLEDPEASDFQLGSPVSPVPAPANSQKPPEALRRGHVALVGAGPGDPELLTLRAIRHLQAAEAIVFDRLVSREILDFAAPGTELVYAGKKKAHHFMRQEEINQTLVELAQAGKRVVRLKGGDPFIFGRGGEEIEALLDAGLDFEVVPGITAASGCATYAGIPLTHRDHAHSCTFVTGHSKQPDLDIRWDALADGRQTVVFYMGLSNLELICERLMAHGRPPHTPAAAIHSGTTSHQAMVVGTLTTLPALTESSHLRHPTLIIVGEVVALHERFQTHHAQPLALVSAKSP